MSPTSAPVSVVEVRDLHGRSYRVGERPRVLYRPDDPAGSASVDAFGALWFVPLLLGLIGAFFVAGGALLLARGASAPIG